MLVLDGDDDGVHDADDGQLKDPAVDQLLQPLHLNVAAGSNVLDYFDSLQLLRLLQRPLKRLVATAVAELQLLLLPCVVMIGPLAVVHLWQ